MRSETELARRLLPLIEIDALEGVALEDEVERLIGQCRGPAGSVASILVWPSFVSMAAQRLGEKPVRIATIINQSGGDDVERAIGDAEEAISDGADEVTLVFPRPRLFRGEEPLVRSMIAEVKDIVEDEALLKVQLDPAGFDSLGELAAVAELLIEEGADFIVLGPARPETPALRTVLDVIRLRARPAALLLAAHQILPRPERPSILRRR